MVWTLTVFITLTLAVLYGMFALLIRLEMARAKPDPEDERYSRERMAYLRAEGERRGKWQPIEEAKWQ